MESNHQRPFGYEFTFTFLKYDAGSRYYYPLLDKPAKITITNVLYNILINLSSDK